jgi:hypothetical protein
MGVLFFFLNLILLSVVPLSFKVEWALMKVDRGFLGSKHTKSQLFNQNSQMVSGRGGGEFPPPPLIETIG